MGICCDEDIMEFELRLIWWRFENAVDVVTGRFAYVESLAVAVTGKLAGGKQLSCDSSQPGTFMCRLALGHAAVGEEQGHLGSLIINLRLIRKERFVHHQLLGIS